jgi:hypothetical protein
MIIFSVKLLIYQFGNDQKNLIWSDNVENYFNFEPSPWINSGCK